MAAAGDVKPLTDDQQAEIHQAFSFYDRDGDDKIKPEELGIVLRSLGHGLLFIPLPPPSYLSRSALLFCPLFLSLLFFFSLFCIFFCVCEQHLLRVKLGPLQRRLILMAQA